MRAIAPSEMMTHPRPGPPTPRTEVRRRPERARYDRATIDSILDEALICHVGFVDEGGPVVIPTIHVRVGGDLLLHGSPASRMIRSITNRPLSAAVTLLDGLVLARSVAHHSMNYRSVVLFGKAIPVDDSDRKLEAIRGFAEKLFPGRWGDARMPTGAEIRETAVVRIPIIEASAKIRTGPPEDTEADLARDTWAGVVPLRITTATPVPAPDLRPGISLPPTSAFGSAAGR
jgi:nitroimidazol reductase NimA-like FMN-containing flavoprotein (pyridoxamine 5'-phosphate oxidase superfamily)